MFQPYLDYIKNNPQHYWFKRKLFGWGWTPATKEGWAVTLIYIFMILGFAFTIDPSADSNDFSFTFLLPFLILTALLITICYKKGEKPQWTWGIPKSEDNSQKNLDSDLN